MSLTDKVIFQNIDKTFGRYSCQDFSIIFMKKNGYINVTKLLCSRSRNYGQWKRGKIAKNILNVFSEYLNIPVNDLTITVYQAPKTNSKIDKYETRGTYVHKYLINSIVMWYSPTFAIKLAKILDEWTLLNKENKQRYWSEMIDCVKNTPDEETGREYMFRDRIANEEDGKIEVITTSGRIDVLTKQKIIEVKIAYNWKHALGQVLCYCEDYEDKLEPWIYLFDHVKCNKDHIKSRCNKFNVGVRFIE